MKVQYALIAAFSAALHSIALAKDAILCDSPGERFTGILWYRCEPDNSITVLGCKAETGEQARLGQNIRTSAFVYACVKKDDRYVQLVPKRCIIGHSVLRAGEKAAFEDFFYECKKLKRMLYMDIVGCVNEEGRMVQFGESYRKGDFRYMCANGDEGAYEAVTGCVVDNKDVSVGKTHISGAIYFRCTRNQVTHEVQLTAEGCVDSKKKKHEIGSSFVDGDFEYKCSEISTADGPALYIQVAACYSTDDQGVSKPRPFMDSWYQYHPTNAKFKYKVVCSGDADDASIEPTKCVVDRRGTPLEIDVGCGVAYDRTSAFICEKNEEGDVQIELRSVDNDDTFDSIYKKYGVRKC